MQKKIFKIISLFVLIGAIFLPLCFASDGNNTTGQSIANFLHLIISILSWIWVLIATLAGKLMTNSIIYGEFIHLDQILRKLRNVMKNIANFALGFIFLRTIFKYVFSKENNISEIIKKIFFFIGAGIGIQLSWFAIGAMIDVSTILSASMGSFPSMILAKDGNIQKSLEGHKIYLPKKMTLNLNEEKNDEPFYQNIMNTSGYIEKKLGEFIDSIVPTSNSIAGPLIYIGASVFNFQNYLTKTITMANETDISNLITTFLIKAGMLIFYTIALIMMFIFNIIRVFYLRILIIFSPLLIALRAFKKGNIGPNDEFEPIEKASITNLLTLIFIPVVYITYMGLTLVIIVTIQKIIITNEIKGFGSETVKIEGNTIKTNNSSFTLNGDIWPNWKEDTKTTFNDIFLMILSLALMYGMTYLISSTFSGIGSSTMKSLKKVQDNALNAIPIGSTSIGGITKGSRNLTRDIFGSGSGQNIFDSKIDFQSEDLQSSLGLIDGITPTKQGELKKAIPKDRWSGGSSTFIKKYKDIINNASYKKSKANFKNSENTIYLDNWIGTKSEGLSNSLKYNWQQLLINVGGNNNGKKRIDKINKQLSNDEKINSINSLIDNIDSAIKDKGRKKEIYTKLYKELTGKEKDIKTKLDFMTTEWK